MKTRQLYNLGIISNQSVAVDTVGAWNVQLASFVNSSRFNIFDQYWIKKLRFHFKPCQNIVGLSTSVTQAYLLACIDYDDSVTPTLSGLQERMNVQRAEPYEKLVFDFQPHQVLISQNGSSTGNTNIPSRWNDVATPTVQHYGIKYAIAAAGSVSWQLAWQVTAEAEVDFKMLI